MSLLPIFLKLEGRRGLLVGAGNVALEKVGSLLKTGVWLRVVAPEARAEIRALAAEGKLEWVERAFEPSDLDGNFIVIAATDVPDVNAAVYREAVKRGIPCNSVDDIPNCDFFFGSVVSRGDLQIAISTAGESPAVAQWLRKEIDAQLPADLGEWLRDLGELRREVLERHLRGEERKALLHKLAQLPLCELESCPSRVMARGSVGFVVSHPSDKDKDVARVGHPIPWGGQISKASAKATEGPSTPLSPQRRRPVAGDPDPLRSAQEDNILGLGLRFVQDDLGGDVFVVSHSSDKDVARMGHPGSCVDQHPEKHVLRCAQDDRDGEGSSFPRSQIRDLGHPGSWVNQGPEKQVSRSSQDDSLLGLGERFAQDDLGGDGVVVSHPSDKDKDVVRVGHPFSGEGRRGKVWLVGAGPGDPELLTLKALRLMEGADVVLHDDLVPEAILGLAAGAEVVNVGKRCGAKNITQDQINALMVEEARAGRRVVRLKSGDPLVFGRAAEEMTALREADVEFEVVPGITSALAAAAAIPASLTDRHSASNIIFSTGHHAQSHNDAALPAVEDATRVVYMPGRDLTLLAEEWRLEGLPGELPCVLISRAGQRDQEVFATRLDALGVAPRMQAPSLLLAGWAVREAEGRVQAASAETAARA